MYDFHINEFVVESEINLPGDYHCRSHAIKSGNDRLLIRRGSLDHLSCQLRAVKRQIAYDVGDGVLVEPNNIKIHINGSGEIITVDAPDNFLPLAASWIIGAGLPACTLLRGGLTIHGAGLEIDDNFVGLMAKSGTGKSTLLWSFLQQGARFGNDDAIPVRITNEQITAQPSISLFPKLSQRILENFHIDMPQCEVAPPEIDDYWVPLEAQSRVKEPAELSALFFLEPFRVFFPFAKEPVTITLLPQEIAASLLIKNLQGVWLLGNQYDPEKLLSQCTELAQRVPIYTVNYNRSFENIPHIIDSIRQMLKEVPVNVSPR